VSRFLNQLLVDHDITPLLVDVGASIGPPEVWEAIAPSSIYVGFDPDQRDTHQLQESPFLKAFVVNQAVVADSGDRAHFFLTRSPYCSSTLRPRGDDLADYIFSDLFEVEREVDVPAGTIEHALEKLQMKAVDWLKTDSQGTDLRLYTSLSPTARAGVLAVDVEPGLIDAYEGEDLFVEAHARLVADGFWLSRAAVQGTVRMNRAVAGRVGAKNGLSIDEISTWVRPSPGWIEARYLRRIDRVEAGDRDGRLLLLGVFALVDEQYGFAIDVAEELRRSPRSAKLADRLTMEAVGAIARAGKRQKVMRLPTAASRWLKTMLKPR
jgi:FkbM family methyltransferase